ncbi:hypothetical protein [Parasphingorhabdus marina]|uniref:hypothetical protein n=1 Tax=Parasphingorhabdus marina TaxID=394732 RepID=UPI001161056D|nr:hypothetical protein [Parasphingorhabdus marina]
MSPLFASIGASLTELDDARFQRERLERLEARPAPVAAEVLPAEIVFRVDDPETAVSQFDGYFANLASGAGLQILSTEPRVGKTGSKLLQIDFAVQGREEKVMRFINLAEKTMPIIRFKDWTIQAVDPASGEVQFSGQALAGWAKP